jgi:methylmalonyl-CoA/ethylmalonyl-CoA epimerase
VIGRLNHIGIAVPDIDAAKATYRDIYGVLENAITPTEELPDQGVRYAFVNLPNSQVELLEPLGEDSPLVNFLAKHPNGGQHHICFEVEDIHAARQAMIEKGAAVLGAPRIGAHGTLVIFIHPRESNGVLVELMERPKDH